MPTKNTIVVPCMVKSRLKTCGETKVIVGNSELDAHQQRFEARDDEKDERVDDVHQADLLVVDRGDPLVHHLERRTLARLRSASIASIDWGCVAMLRFFP